MADEAQESRSKLASISDARRNSLPLSADERMAAGKKLREESRAVRTRSGNRLRIVLIRSRC